MERRTFFAVRFYLAVAHSIAGRIIRLNGRRWPRDLSQWQSVARKIKFTVLLVRHAPAVCSSCLFAERVILVRYSPDHRTLQRRLAHEVAHALIFVGGPTGNLLEWPREAEECHHVARLVEGWVDVAIAEDGQLTLFEE